MQKIFKSDTITIDNATNLKASPSVKAIAKSYANATFRVMKIARHGIVELLLTNTPSKNLRVMWVIHDIEESISNGSVVISSKLPTLPKPTTKVFKALRFISEQKDGASMSDIQRFVCTLNGVDFDQRKLESWSGKMVRVNRGYYTTNIARWNKVYLTKKNKKYFLREDLVSLMKTEPKMDNVKTPDVEKQVETEVDEVAIEVSRLMAVEATHVERLATLNKQMDDLKLQIQMANTSRALNKEKLKKILVHSGMFVRNPVDDALIS